jgi:hypothetical protein
MFLCQPHLYLISFRQVPFPKKKIETLAPIKNDKGILDKAFNTLVTMKEQMQIKPTSN